MKTSDGTAVKARAWVNLAVGRITADGTGRLPTIKQMARSAGVSHKVMGAAIAALVREGVLEVRRCAGIRLKSHPAAGATVAPAEPAVLWQRVQKQLHHDMVNGAFGFNQALPLHKELTARYGVTYKTLRKALASLVGTGVLVQSKRTFRASRPVLSTGRNTLVLFARGRISGMLDYVTPRALEDYLSLERECVAHNVRLKYVSCYPGPDEFVFDDGIRRVFLAQDTMHDRITGYCVWQVSLEAVFVTGLIQWLAHAQKPIVLFNDSGEDLAPVPAAARVSTRTFEADRDREAGRKMGRYLLSLGHRRVCLFTFHHHLAWARERSAGMCEAFARAGIDHGIDEISVFTDPSWQQQWFSRWSETPLLDDLNAVAIKRGGRPFREDTGLAAGKELTLHSHREELACALLPGMRDRLKKRGATAWVGINDSVASECLRFLRESGISVPGEISVAGFDDDRESAYRGITSFNFNGASAQHAIVDHLLRPGSARTKGRPADVAVEGIIHERASTAKMTP